MVGRISRSWLGSTTSSLRRALSVHQSGVHGNARRLLVFRPKDGSTGRLEKQSLDRHGIRSRRMSLGRLAVGPGYVATDPVVEGGRVRVHFP
jgi:hypothetical protein